ncbi:hypothetical protein M0802_007365 [Mischocyttarus mexicanus]|nr:hypothetical protein M0802_007365 [Mischocyttarus mexicanus]
MTKPLPRKITREDGNRSGRETLSVVVIVNLVFVVATTVEKFKLARGAEKNGGGGVDAIKIASEAVPDARNVRVTKAACLSSSNCDYLDTVIVPEDFVFKDERLEKGSSFRLFRLYLLRMIRVKLSRSIG